jgi:hypothetical protein
MKTLAGNLLKEIEENTIPLGGPPIQQKGAKKEARWLK